jgi:hypothetical protein
MAKKTKIKIDTEHADYKRLVELQRQHNELTGALNKLQTELDACHRDWLNKVVDDAISAQSAKERIEGDAELLCRRHEGDWFAEQRTVKTPLGTASFHKSTELAVANAELALQLMDQADGKILAPEQPSFIADNYKRVEQSLNLDALNTLPDAVLVQFKITRVAKDNFSLKPAKVDLGQAVKEKAAEKSAEKKAA